MKTKLRIIDYRGIIVDITLPVEVNEEDLILSNNAYVSDLDEFQDDIETMIIKLH